MLASTANRDSFQVTTVSDQEIRMTRVFGAPRALVYEAMTKPEHVRPCTRCGWCADPRAASSTR